MDVIPPVNVARFEQLRPGDLFVSLEGRTPYFAIKTAQPANGDKSEMVLLGPAFPRDIKESYILPWQPSTVVSYGQDYSLLLSADPASWFQNGDTRQPVCLAVSGEDVFICTNASGDAFRHVPCFVNVRTGEIVEYRLSGITAYTHTWELVIPRPNMPPLSLLKYPAS